MKDSEINEEKKLQAGKQSGIVELIVLVIVALLIMKYFNITISGVINWFTSFFGNVLK